MLRPILALSAIAVLALPGRAAAQQHNLSIEAFGPTILGSVNYEMVFERTVSLRTGMGWLPGLDNGDVLMAPLMGNLLLGRGEHRLEVGAGAVLAYSLNRGPEDDPELPARRFLEPHAAATVAYRLEPGPRSEMNGIVYRVGYTPIILNGEVHGLYAASVGVNVATLRERFFGTSSAQRTR